MTLLITNCFGPTHMATVFATCPAFRAEDKLKRASWLLQRHDVAT